MKIPGYLRLANRRFIVVITNPAYGGYSGLPVKPLTTTPSTATTSKTTPAPQPGSR